MIGEILKEGLFWAALGRPREVMPFLRGKLLSNGYSGRAKEELEGILSELELFYERISWEGRIEQKHLRALRSFHREILALVSAGRRA
ncbi:MAG: hypothetical protein PWQ79_583 [Thermococcaceae archaeon]|nr:hypothetical protein [Thermococcaceae archaeon]MDK2913668.1 hypothetical protein [Thermococcaceae archaeon]